MTFAVLCTGPSMSQAVADSVRHLRVIAVNNTYELAPWAESLVAVDLGWWGKNPSALKFPGDRFSSFHVKHVKRVPSPIKKATACGGVLALEVAKMKGAERVLLLGADFHGSHYFGDYRNGLQNTTDKRRAVHRAQFEQWQRSNKGIEVLNCTEGSMLECFPRMSLSDALCLS